MSLGPEDGGINPGFPPDEAAPTLSTYWGFKPDQSIHVSNLTPDLEAKMSLKMWAKLFYQLENLSPYGDSQTYACTPEVDIAVSIPVTGVYPNDASVTAAIGNNLQNEHGVIDGRRRTLVNLYLNRPGLVEVSDTFITIPEALPEVTTFEATTEINERSGPYMAKDGSGVGFKQMDYLIGDSGAEQIIELMRSASPIPARSAETIFTDRWNASLEQMSPGLREACHRYFIDYKDLVVDPEDAFRDTSWTWDYLPAQASRPTMGLIAHHSDKFVVYAPPLALPCDSVYAFELLVELSETDSDLWITATWDDSELPGDYDPLFADPTDIRPMSLKDIVAELPDTVKEQLAKWAEADLWRSLRWFKLIRQEVELAQELDETEFARRKREAEETNKHFFWKNFASYKRVLQHAARGETYQEAREHYELIESRYRTKLVEFCELFPEFAEKSEIPASIWESEEAKQVLYEKLLDLYVRLSKY